MILNILSRPWIEHLLSIFTSTIVIAYIIFRRKDLVRSTHQTPGVYWAIGGATAVLLVLNGYRVIDEYFNIPENQFSAAVDIIASYGSLIGQTLLVLFLLEAKIVVERIYTPGRVLVIGAHPGDIEIAAGASIAKLHDVGFEITGLVLSHGECEGCGGNHPNEPIKESVFPDIDDFLFMDFADRQMAEKTDEIAKEIEKIASKFRPNFILTHSRHDHNPDHLAIYESTLCALQTTRATILSYECPTVTADFNPNYFIDVFGYVDAKIETIMTHCDQKLYAKPDLIRNSLLSRGNQAKVEYAEGYEIVRMVSAI
jgi:LmbE family N-acetylglucosaminyl deacetylase